VVGGGGGGDCNLMKKGGIPTNHPTPNRYMQRHGISPRQQTTYPA